MRNTIPRGNVWWGGWEPVLLGHRKAGLRRKGSLLKKMEWCRQSHGVWETTEDFSPFLNLPCSWPVVQWRSGIQCAAVHGIAESQTQLSDWTASCTRNPALRVFWAAPGSGKSSPRIWGMGTTPSGGREEHSLDGVHSRGSSWPLAQPRLCLPVCLYQWFNLKDVT